MLTHRYKSIIVINTIICQSKGGEDLKLYDYEKLIIGIWPNISNYPSACSLIAKSLLDKDVFNLIAE